MGILGPQYTNRGKTCTVDGGLTTCFPPNMPERLCGMPWEKKFGLPSTYATQLYLTNCTFGGFPGVEPACGGSSSGAYSAAYAPNPSQLDLAVPVYARSIVWDGVGVGGRFSFRPTAATPLEGKGGVILGGGDGFQGILMHDSDGSLTGTLPKSSVLGPNPSMSQDAPTCTWVEAWQGSYCPGITYRQAIMENLGAFFPSCVCVCVCVSAPPTQPLTQPPRYTPPASHTPVCLSSFACRCRPWISKLGELCHCTTSRQGTE